MSTRKLISRQQRVAAEDSPPRRSRNETAPPARQTTALPPYQPSSLPLTDKYQRALTEITNSHDYSRYKTHVQGAISSMTNCTADVNERLTNGRERLKRQAKRRVDVDEDPDRAQADQDAEDRLDDFGTKVDKITSEAEKSLRNLIDYRDELAQQNGMLGRISTEAIESALAASQAQAEKDAQAQARSQRRKGAGKRNPNSVDDYDAIAEDHETVEEQADDGPEVEIISPMDLLQKAKKNYINGYVSKTMRQRYAENNDYIGFKRAIHDSQHPDQNAPPVPHPSTWFPSEAVRDDNKTSSARRRRQGNRADNTGNGDDDDDDDIEIAGAVSSLKCPLTLATFKQPFSNYICKHSFEKSAIKEYWKENAISWTDPTQPASNQPPRRRGEPVGEKQIKCPQHGCEALLKMEDFYDDQIIARQVKRAAAQEAAEMHEDEEEDDVMQDDDSDAKDVEDE